jgi:hypothetical protein
LINDGYMVEIPLRDMLLRYFDVNPKLDVWMSSMEIITKLEALGLRGDQKRNLMDLAAVAKTLGLQKERRSEKGQYLIRYRGVMEKR